MSLRLRERPAAPEPDLQFSVAEQRADNADGCAHHESEQAVARIVRTQNDLQAKQQIVTGQSAQSAVAEAAAHSAP